MSIRGSFCASPGRRDRPEHRAPAHTDLTKHINPTNHGNLTIPITPTVLTNLAGLADLTDSTFRGAIRCSLTRRGFARSDLIRRGLIC
jgi:hypothetical protein